VRLFTLLHEAAVDIKQPGLGSVEKKEKDLRTMHATVIKDKRKIEETIERLDEYKLEALTKAWNIVNGSVHPAFSSLFLGFNLLF